MNLLYRNFSETGGAENINISFEKGSEKEDILSYLKKKGYIGVVFDKETECNSRITIEGINFFERQFGEAKGNIYEQYEISRLQEELKELHKILHEVIRRG
jgi:hypothetical protein